MSCGATDTPERRYGCHSPLNRLLSGVQLIERTPPVSAPHLFYPHSDDTKFCGFLDINDIYKTFADSGCFDHWKKQNYHQIEIRIPPPLFPNRYELSVWTIVNNQYELLMQLVVWLEYIYFKHQNIILPAFNVEHLRLQSPGKPFIHPKMPGQDFASSGILRRIFAIISRWSLQTGASLIANIPEFFHTAYIFSEYFTFADDEMEYLFQTMKRDLLFNHSRDCITKISNAFEQGNILCNHKTYYWPTELQIYITHSDLKPLFQFNPHPFQQKHVHFECINS